MVRPIPTLLVGIVGGLVVGMTSVGSGSLMIVALLLLYPSIRAGQLVGTDLVQAVPLVASASLGHLLFGDFQLDLTASLLIGALPGVYVGARVSSVAPGGIVRRALVVVLLASGLKLLEASRRPWSWLVLLSVAVIGPLLWATVYRKAAAGRRRHPARPTCSAPRSPGASAGPARPPGSGRTSRRALTGDGSPAAGAPLRRATARSAPSVESLPCPG